MASRSTSRVPGMVFALAVLGTLPILWRVVLPMLDGANWPRHPGHLPIILTHAIAGTGMLLFGTAAIFIGWTRRGFRFHRQVGFAYLACGTVASIAVLVVAAHPPHEPKSLFVATGTLACVWLAAAAMAWRAAHNRRYASHREWMIRSYVLTWTFVGCRLATIVDVYPWLGIEGVTAAIWVNWIVPLVVCEIALRWREGARVDGG